VAETKQRECARRGAEVSHEIFGRRLRRREFLKLSGGLALAGALPLSFADPLRALAASGALRQPGSLPFPSRPAGVPQPDLAPDLANIDHIIIVMMENHSFDNYFGMLPYRTPALAGKVDGFPAVDSNGVPTVTQFDSRSQPHHAFPMPNACQQGAVSQSWTASHLAYDNGNLDGFVLDGASSPSALGYWDESILPFYYSLASTFPVCDRYFSSTLCQTYPNRVFLMAATAAGLISTDTPPPTVTPANGHIFSVLNAYNINWQDYYAELPSPGLFGAAWAAQQEGTHLFGPTAAPQGAIAAFQAACTAGTLAPVVLVEPDYQFGSEENPQDVQVGQTFVAGVINALMGSPAWSRSLLMFVYDEHGGYYDHVSPPAALNPGDGSHPNTATTYGDDYTRYGFRVPAVVVSPWAKANFTSHTVYDHTSILATIERKWNLPALTLRDANANPLSDCLVSSGLAPFATPPSLVAAPLHTEADSIACMRTGNPAPPASQLPDGAAPMLVAAGVAAAGAGTAAFKGTRQKERAG
jgi:phospholipase C